MSNESHPSTHQRLPPGEDLSVAASRGGGGYSLALDRRDPRVKRVLAKGKRFDVSELLRGRLPRESVDSYNRLFNEVRNDANIGLSSGVDLGQRGYGNSQNGIVIWTGTEKEVLFTMLERKGKNGVAEIADAIGTKSELEVADYLRLLHRGLGREHLRYWKERQKTIGLGEIPAAAEISEECCEALDEYAALLRLRENDAEDVNGKKKHKDVWIVTGEKAEEIEKRIQVQEESIQSQQQQRNQSLPESEPVSKSSIIYLPATLLNLTRWIRFSERFFMNASQARFDDNWVNLSHADELPSITAEAFADFYALTVSVTRRLVQSALFMAMSRIRNMQNHTESLLVKARDVRTTMDVLNMKHGHFDFWPGLARRCSLDVADFQKGWSATYLDYDEVEDLLSSEGPIGAGTGSEEGEEGEEEEEEEGQDDTSSMSSFVVDTYAGKSILERAQEEEKQQSEMEYGRTNRIDRNTSQAEERRLWNLMKGIPESREEQEDPSSRQHSAQPFMKTEDLIGDNVNEDGGNDNGSDDESEEDGEEEEVNETTVPLQYRPPGRRKVPRDLVDWRDSILLYRSEWETYGHEMAGINYDIEENHRQKKRRIEDSEVDDDDDDDDQSGDIEEDEVDDEDENEEDEDEDEDEDDDEEESISESQQAASSV